MHTFFWSKNPVDKETVANTFVCIRSSNIDAEKAIDLIKTAKGGYVTEISNIDKSKTASIDIYNFITPSTMLTLTDTDIKKFNALLVSWELYCSGYEKETLEIIRPYLV